MPLVSPVPRRPHTGEGLIVRTSNRGPLDAWRALGWLGASFALVGLIDVALGWYPWAFGNAEWEFGTISGTLNALAIPMLGLYLVLASAIARSDGRSGRVVAVVMGILMVTVLGLGVIYLTVLPLAIKAVAGNALVTLGIKKAVVKAVLLGIMDSVLLGFGMVKGWRIPPAA